MTRILSIALAALPTLAWSEGAIETGNSVADGLIETAISEQRVFFTCSSLSARTHTFVVDGWRVDVTKAVEILTKNGVAPQAIAGFLATADVNALRLAPETPFSDLITFCSAHPDWETALFQLRYTALELSLPKAFAK